MKKDIKQGLSVIRIFATLCVIYLHTCSTLISDTSTLNMAENVRYFFQANMDFVIFSTPLFFMISGALLLEKKIDFEKLKIRIIKMIVCLFLFGVPMACMSRFYYSRSINLELLIMAIKDVLTFNSWDHLWFIYYIVVIYCLLPLINKIYRYNDGLYIWIFVLLYFIICIVFHKTPFSNHKNIVLSVFYFVLGALLYKYGHTVKLIVRILFLILMIILSLNCVLMGRLSQLAIYQPVTVLISSAIFMCFYNIKYDERINKYLWKIDRLCFGVYLIHPFFIHLTYSLINIYPTDFNPYQFFNFVFFIVFTLLSFSSSYIMSKIPFLSKLLT